MTTIVHVAREAGVSTSTVSHVLNGTRPVEPATRQRVLDAIERTSYRRDALARTMRRSRTDSIGLILSDAGEPAFAEMVHGVEQAAAERGLVLLLANSGEDRQREEDVVQALLERRVDGVILARAADSSGRVIDLLNSPRTHTVLIDRVFPDLALDQVAAENHQPMIELVTHLTEQGHERFCVVVGDTRVATLAERMAGFEAAVAALGLRAADQTIVTGAVADVSRQLGSSLKGGDAPTAYIACSTVLAAATLRELAANGVGTPRDIAFATFDGFDQPDLFEPRITTVRQPAFEIGQAAVELLGRALDGTEPKETMVRRVPQTIEYRDSTERYGLSAG